MALHYRKENISNQLIDHIEKTFNITKNQARCIITLADIIPELYIAGFPLLTFCIDDIKSDIAKQTLFICVGLKKDHCHHDIRVIENMIENIFNKKLTITHNFTFENKTKKLILKINPRFDLKLTFTEYDPKQYIIDRSDVDIGIKFYNKSILYSKTNFTEKKFDMIYSKANNFKYTNEQAKKFLESGFSFRIRDEETNTDELKCKICTINKVKKVFNCGHMICYKCFMNLQKTECPYCRQSFIPWEIPLLHF